MIRTEDLNKLQALREKAKQLSDPDYYDNLAEEAEAKYDADPDYYEEVHSEEDRAMDVAALLEETLGELIIVLTASAQN